MKIRIDRTRMAMRGKHYAYDALVLTSDAPQVDRYSATTVVKDGGKEYYRFEVATLPASHWQREKGWERYEEYLVHEEASKARLLRIAQTVYPELAYVSTWPTLWCCIPSLDAGHATRYAEVSL